MYVVLSSVVADTLLVISKYIVVLTSPEMPLDIVLVFIAPCHALSYTASTYIGVVPSALLLKTL